MSSRERAARQEDDDFVATLHDIHDDAAIAAAAAAPVSAAELAWKAAFLAHFAAKRAASLPAPDGKTGQED